MRIKLDENLPESLVKCLTSLGHDVDNVREEGIAFSPDGDVWAAAQHEGRFLVTQDLDFSDVRKFTAGQHHGLLLVRLRLPGRLALARRLLGVFQLENTASWAGCYVLVTDWKIRVQRPKT